MNTGQIFKIHSDFYYVNSDSNIFECKVRDVLKKQKNKIMVGDYIKFDDGFIVEVLARKNYITRPSVANIDQVIIVSAVKEPDLSFQQLNRYISLAKYHSLDTKLCFNKNDLSLDDSIIEKIFSIYEPLGYEIVFTSALEKIGIEDFAQLLEGKTSVLCGSSGVGKSSLINAINPDLNLKTKYVSEKTERGVHTTRHCEIIDITKSSKIVDTPGFSNIKFDFIMPNEVDELFDEIKVFKPHCKFKNCLHVYESGCEVLKNINKIDSTRYASYLAFIEEAKEFKEQVKYSGKKRETTSKNIHNRLTTKISAKKRESARNTAKQNILKDFDDESN